jgi:predicted RNase H-like HicB family nuclease
LNGKNGGLNGFRWQGELRKANSKSPGLETKPGAPGVKVCIPLVDEGDTRPSGGGVWYDVVQADGAFLVAWLSSLSTRISSMIFHVSLEKAEDGWIVAQCPALPGCISQGRDEKEALENIKEAITAWLWAEDQKAVKGMRPESTQVVVAV